MTEINENALTPNSAGDHSSENLTAADSYIKTLEKANATLNSQNSDIVKYAKMLEKANLELEKQVQIAVRYEEISSQTFGQITLMNSLLHNLRLANIKTGTENGDKRLSDLYLELLENALTGLIYQDTSISPFAKEEFDLNTRAIGRDWPSHAHTMIGVARMKNLRQLAETVIVEQVPGDFLEAGVWRGGACIYMRGILKAYDINDRKVFVADSFEGLPPPDEQKYPRDAGDTHHTQTSLAVSIDQVRQNFDKYNLLDEKVVFLKGWFNQSLPSAPIDKLSILRLDGDMYSSTMETLTAMFSKVSKGGFIIVDDYILPAARAAVEDFRSANIISDHIIPVDGSAVYWRKS